MSILKFSCFLIFHQFIYTSFGKKRDYHCVPSSCGTIHNISFPFRLKDDPQHCGHPDYELSCENNKTLIHFNMHKYVVQSINYNNYTIRIADVSITNEDVCSFLGASLTQSYFYYSYGHCCGFKNDICNYTRGEETAIPVIFISCMHEVINASHYIPVASYNCGHINGDVEGKRYSYIVIGHFNVSELMDTCRMDGTVWTSSPSLLHDEGKTDVPLSRIHGSLLYGFEFTWLPFMICSGLVDNKSECYKLKCHFRSTSWENILLGKTWVRGVNNWILPY